MACGVWACGDEDTGSDDARAEVTATNETRDDSAAPDVADTAGTDALDGLDVAEVDDGFDATETKGDGDTTDSADTAEVATPCVPAAEVFPDPRFFECDGVLTGVMYWEDLSETECPAYYTIGDQQYDSVDELDTELGCDIACEYRATHAVDLIGCVSEHRTGYEVYEADGEGCLEAVYGTPKGPLRDLCDWEEKACRSDCDPDCQEGVVGALDATQLSGKDGTRTVNDELDQGQSFRVGASGILSGIELRAFRCDSAMPASLTLFDGDGIELGYAEVPNADLPAGCGDSGDLQADARGPVYFALETTCIAVTAGDALRFRVSRPMCDIPPCPDGPSVGYAFDAGYADGTAFADDEAIPAFDLAFKVFVK